MIFPNRLPATHRIVETTCSDADGVIRYYETGMTYKTEACARKIAARLCDRDWHDGGDVLYRVVPIDKPANYIAPAPKFFAPDVDALADCPW